MREQTVTYVGTFGARETHDARLPTSSLGTRGSRATIFTRGSLKDRIHSQDIIPDRVISSQVCAMWQAQGTVPAIYRYLGFTNPTHRPSYRRVGAPGSEISPELLIFIITPPPRKCSNAVCECVCLCLFFVHASL